MMNTCVPDMPNRYVGLRYVPFIAGEWSSTTAYDPLTVVLYQGNSYTSRTFVPVGVLPTNNTYWAQTGNYNAQVEQYRKDTVKVQTDVNNLSVKVDELFADLWFPKTNQTTDPEGFCGVLKTTSNSCILFDLGLDANYNNIKASLIKNGITTISAIIISHYHSDHTGDIALFKADFDTTNTIIFLPLTTAKFAYTTERNQYIVNTMRDNTIVYPINNDKRTIDGVELTFCNCGATTISYWDSNTTDYNNYSMCTYATYYGSTYFNTADIAVEAEQYIYDNGWYMPSVIVSAPHHSHNYDGASDLVLELSSHYVYVADSVILTKTVGYQDNFTQAFGLFGANMYRNSDNPTDIHFQIGKHGVAQVNALGKPLSLYGFTGFIDYYVDSSYTGSSSTGSSKKPFTSIRAAFESCKDGFNYNINVVNMEKESVYLRNINNVTVTFNKAVTFNSLSFNMCSNITFNNVTNLDVTIGTFEIYNSSNVYMRHCILNTVKPIEKCTNIQFRDSALNSARTDYVFNCYNSHITFLNCSTATAASNWCKLENSIVNSDANFANFSTITTSIFLITGCSDVVYGTSYFATKENMLKLFGTTNKAFLGLIVSQWVILRNGTFTNLTN